MVVPSDMGSKLFSSHPESGTSEMPSKALPAPLMNVLRDEELLFESLLFEKLPFERLSDIDMLMG